MTIEQNNWLHCGAFTVVEYCGKCSLQMHEFGMIYDDKWEKFYDIVSGINVLII